MGDSRKRKGRHFPWHIRGIYVAVKDKKVVVLPVFVKKTQKTPKKEIDIAKKRAKEAGLI